MMFGTFWFRHPIWTPPILMQTFRRATCILLPSKRNKQLNIYYASIDSVQPIALTLNFKLARAIISDFSLIRLLTSIIVTKIPIAKGEVPTREKIKSPIPIVDRKIFECNNGKDFVARPKPYGIVNMGPQINSESGDYAPVLNEREDEIIFTSRRLDGNLNENVFSDNKPFEDIFISTKVNGRWTKAANIGRTVNIPDHNSNLALSPDGKTLFQYRSDNGGDIYISELQSNGSWSAPRPIPGVVNSPYYESSMSISPDGQTLYFASERPGGLGGMDLYSCTKDRRGVWGRLKNLGPTINTAGHDDSPFIDYSGKKLYFSSDSHKGMGGYDIYETTLLNESKNEWSEPVNLGYPINTADNDIYFVGTSDGKRGYFASIREDGLGYLDIYAVIPKD